MTVPTSQNPPAHIDVSALEEVVVGLRAWTVSFPLTTRLRHASVDVAALTSVVVEIELSGGICGRAEVRSNGAYATGENQPVIVAALRAVAVHGRTVRQIGDQLADRSRLARMAVDTAAWDALARRAGVPLYQLWNPTAVQPHSVRTHAPIGFATIDDAVQSARSFTDAGFDRLKIRVGSAELADDIARVRAIRAAVGPDITFVIDVNGGWTYDVAAAAIDALTEPGLAWIEQPVTGMRELARLRRKSGVPIYADETARDPDSVRSLAAERAVDGVHLKLEKSGTATLLFQTVEAAQAHGLAVALGQMDQGQLGCAVTTHLAVALGLQRAELWGWAGIARDLTDTMQIRDGGVVVPTGIGHGIDSIDTTLAQEIM